MAKQVAGKQGYFPQEPKPNWAIRIIGVIVALIMMVVAFALLFSG
jgi:hypothetical protein